MIVILVTLHTHHLSSTEPRHYDEVFIHTKSRLYGIKTDELFIPVQPVIVLKRYHQPSTCYQARQSG